MVNSKKSSTFAAAKEKHRGVEQLVARQAHNLEVACSSPASATTAAFYGLLFLWCQDIVHAKTTKAQVVIRLLALLNKNEIIFYFILLITRS